MNQRCACAEGADSGGRSQQAAGSPGQRGARRKDLAQASPHPNSGGVTRGRLGARWEQSGAWEPAGATHTAKGTISGTSG